MAHGLLLVSKPGIAGKSAREKYRTLDIGNRCRKLGTSSFWPGEKDASGHLRRYRAIALTMNSEGLSADQVPLICDAI